MTGWISEMIMRIRALAATDGESHRAFLANARR
jgi:hypothetical protein